jgi:hypothetical protein
MSKRRSGLHNHTRAYCYSDFITRKSFSITIPPNIMFETNAQLETLRGIKYINGTILIDFNFISNDIINIAKNNTEIPDLTVFDDLIVLNGSLIFLDCSSLTTISGFTNLTIITNLLNITNNSSLENLSGFTSITKIGGGIIITDNTNLQICKTTYDAINRARGTTSFINTSSIINNDC